MIIDPGVLAVAQRALTAKQYEAWKLDAEGWRTESIMMHLDIHKSTLRDRLLAADINLIRAGVRMDASGNYYHEETA